MNQMDYATQKKLLDQIVVREATDRVHVQYCSPGSPPNMTDVHAGELDRIASTSRR
jgi:hypothetical protein